MRLLLAVALSIVSVHEAAAACGDGILDTGETCDDGGTAPGDGCDAACATEAGWTCSGTPSTCDFDECAQNTDDCGDNATCTNTAGSYTCMCKGGFTGSGHGPNSCADIDECAAHLDGCPIGSFCTNSSPYYFCTCTSGGSHPAPGGHCPSCGDGTKQSNEECDDGNTDPDDGCDACRVVPIPDDGCSTGTPSAAVAILVIGLAGLRRRKRA